METLSVTLTNKFTGSTATVSLLYSDTHKLLDVEQAGWNRWTKAVDTTCYTAAFEAYQALLSQYVNQGFYFGSGE